MVGAQAQRWLRLQILMKAVDIESR